MQRRVGEQPVGQRLDAGLARDQPFAAALGLVGQVQVLQHLLGGGGVDGRAQLGRELALLLDALTHRGTAFVQLAQVAQAHFELAQLVVVQAVGGLLAVARDEGHAGPAVEQFDGALHLGRARAQFGGNLQQDRVQKIQAPWQGGE